MYIRMFEFTQKLHKQYGKKHKKVINFLKLNKR
jgi:hypothetical protein